MRNNLITKMFNIQNILPDCACMCMERKDEQNFSLFMQTPHEADEWFFSPCGYRRRHKTTAASKPSNMKSDVLQIETVTFKIWFLDPANAHFTKRKSPSMRSFWPYCTAAPFCDQQWSQMLWGLQSVVLQHTVSSPTVRHDEHGVKVHNTAHMIQGKSFFFW